MEPQPTLLTAPMTRRCRCQGERRWGGGEGGWVGGGTGGLRPSAGGWVWESTWGTVPPALRGPFLSPHTPAATAPPPPPPPPRPPALLTLWASAFGRRCRRGGVTNEAAGVRPGSGGCANGWRTPAAPTAAMARSRVRVPDRWVWGGGRRGGRRGGRGGGVGWLRCTHCIPGRVALPI